MATNVATGLPPQPAPLVDSKGIATLIWYQFFNQLLARTGGGAGVDIAAVAAAAAAAQATASAALVSANASLKKVANLGDVASAAASRGNLGLGPQGGWTTPTGTELKAGFNADASTTFSGAYNAAEGQAVNDQLLVVQRNLAALIATLTALDLLGP